MLTTTSLLLVTPTQPFLLPRSRVPLHVLLAQTKAQYDALVEAEAEAEAAAASASIRTDLVDHEDALRLFSRLADPYVLVDPSKGSCCRSACTSCR